LKNFVKILSLAVLVFSSFFVGESKAVCEKIRIAYTDNWFPIAYDDGDKHGFGIALAVQKEMFQRLGISVEYIREIPWLRQLAMVERGDIDAMAALYFNDERAGKFTYSEPFYTTTVHVYKRRNSALEYTQLEDLIDYRGVASRGASFGTDFDSFSEKNLNIHRVNGTEKIIQMLVKNRADYMVLPRSLALNLINKYNVSGTISQNGPPITINNIHMAFSRKTECRAIVSKVNSTIVDMKADGTLAELVEKQARLLGFN